MKKPAYILFIVLSVIALDQITKFLIIGYLPLFDSIEILPFLHIVNIRNTGAAFGMFKSLGSSFFIGISVIAIIFVTNLLIRNIYNSLGLSLVLGGATGNLIDRILYGKVVDFIDFSIGSYHWPSFNVADSALSVGIILILLKSVLKK
jgi:signal peptidase II